MWHSLSEIGLTPNALILYLVWRSPTGEARVDESFGVLDNAVYEFLAARDIVNQTCDHTCGPDASIECPIVQGASPTLSGDQMLDVINCGITARLDVSDFIGDLVPEHASRVPECPEDKCRITFGGFDETLLDDKVRTADGRHFIVNRHTQEKIPLVN